MSSRFLYFADDVLSEAELSAACLDGHLVGIGEGFVPADTVETDALRAASLRPLVGDKMAASHRSAAWVHGFADAAPARHDVQRICAHRLHEPVDRRFVYRDPRVPEHDLVTVGGIAVTTPGRTIADLARGLDSADDRILAACARHEPAAIRAGLAWLRVAYRIPRSRIAIERIEALVRMT